MDYLKDSVFKFKFILVKSEQNGKFSPSATLAIFQALSSPPDWCCPPGRTALSLHTTLHGDEGDRGACQTPPRGCHPPGLECGTFFRTDDSLTSANKGP